MASRLTRAAVLEVERKFHSLAVAELTQHGGVPPFRSLQKLPSKSIRDIYYDRDGRLAAAGTWLRQRNGVWGAKIRKGGDYNNSRFEEVEGEHDTAAHVQSLLPRQTGSAATARLSHLGLLPTAEFITQRQTWLADDDFRIVLDVMDFGHQVGEVELQQTVDIAADPSEGDRQKRQAMQAMDDRLVAFLERYAWAFTAGKPVGKLTAYFEKMGRR